MSKHAKFTRKVLRKIPNTSVAGGVAESLSEDGSPKVKVESDVPSDVRTEGDDCDAMTCGCDGITIESDVDDELCEFGLPRHSRQQGKRGQICADSALTCQSNSRLERMIDPLRESFAAAVEHKMMGIVDAKHVPRLVENMRALCFSNKREPTDEICECEVVYEFRGDTTQPDRDRRGRPEVRLRYSFPINYRSACLVRFYDAPLGEEYRKSADPGFSRPMAHFIAQPTIHSALSNMGWSVRQRFVMKGSAFRWSKGRVSIVIYKAYPLRINASQTAVIESEPIVDTTLVEVSAIAMGDQPEVISDMQNVVRMMSHVHWFAKPLHAYGDGDGVPVEAQRED